MRTENSIKNIIMNFLYNILNYGLRFISRIIFVKTLAEVYLGVNGLLSNVLGMIKSKQKASFTFFNFLYAS